MFLIDPEDVAIADPRITQIRQVATKGMETFRRMLGQVGFKKAYFHQSQWRIRHAS